MKMNKKKGFTLVELIVVIVILGILMLIGSMKYADVKKQANLRMVQTNHRTLVSAIQLKVAENQGEIPKADDIKIDGSADAIASGVLQDKPKGTTYTYDGAKLTTVATEEACGKAVKIETDFATGVTTGLD